MFGGWNGEKGSMNDVYIIDLSTMVKCVCVCVCVLVHGHVHVIVCVYLFVSVCCNGQTFLCILVNVPAQSS